MRRLSSLLVAMLAWAILASTSSAQPCPGLAVAIAKLRLSPAGKVVRVVGGRARTTGRKANIVRAGGHVYALVTLTNTGRRTLEGVALRVQLPDFLEPVRASTWPPLKKRSSSAARGPLFADVRDLYWTGLILAPRKTRGFLVKALVPGCQNTTATLAVEAAAYVTANDGTTVTCLTKTDPSRFGVSPALAKDLRNDRDKCTPVPPPEPIPDNAGYSFYASGQRCTEAVLTPLRRLTAVGKADDRHHQRVLSPTTNPTPEECRSPACCWACVIVCDRRH